MHMRDCVCIVYFMKVPFYIKPMARYVVYFVDIDSIFTGFLVGWLSSYKSHQMQRHLFFQLITVLLFYYQMVLLWLSQAIIASNKDILLSSVKMNKEEDVLFQIQKKKTSLPSACSVSFIYALYELNLLKVFLKFNST